MADNMKVDPQPYRCRLNIRLATADDLPTLVIFGRHFYEHTLFRQWIAYSEAGAEANFRQMIDNGMLFCAVIDEKVVGTIGAIVGPCLINTDHGMAAEMFWWVEPEFRRSGAGDKLMDAVEAEAKSRGITFFSMVALEGGTVEQAGRIYEKRGYIPMERVWLKVL